ncbi:unnamed protein product [Eruca vesicaria subsp. sativa]|uniref:Uncharacterized protein n=1 Tax=Eruca vesicaria subsp. sativa TaxID=29727 RepID=A0ABC8JP15_ERUVS|nr:unnamed protein product [Eruca vesicaria subsp. sativa]
MDKVNRNNEAFREHHRGHLRCVFVAISVASSDETCIRRNIDSSQPPISTLETKVRSIIITHAERLCRDMAREAMFQQINPCVDPRSQKWEMVDNE